MDAAHNTTNQMMDEELYWKIVDASFKKSSNLDNQEEYLIETLMEMPPAGIIGFKLRTYKLLADIYNPEMWCAGYIMNKGLCSDDGFEYFRSWVISRGKETFYNAKNNPDTLINQRNDRLGFYDFEAFGYVAVTAYEAKTGKSIYDQFDNTFPYYAADHPEMEFNWNKKQPETMRAICPQLFETMWDLEKSRVQMKPPRKFLPLDKNLGGPHL